MTPDSHVPTIVRPSLGFRRGKYEPRTRAPAATIIHTAGWGPCRRFLDEEQRARHGWRTPFDAALWLYEEAMEAGPTYVVGQAGECAQVSPEAVCAWHVGGAGARPYARLDGSWAGPEHRWWRQRWLGYGSPRELAGGALWTPYARRTSIRVAIASLAGSVNANAFGIEVVPPLEGPRAPWSRACWATLAVLVEDIHDRHELAVERDRVITHSDGHPLARTAHGRPWDTYEEHFTWERYCTWTSRDPATGRALA